MRVEAIVNRCYRFLNWTSIDGEILSVEPVYEFIPTKDMTLIANFFAIDFDEYVLTFWENTFMLNMAKIR